LTGLGSFNSHIPGDSIPGLWGEIQTEPATAAITTRGTSQVGHCEKPRDEAISILGREIALLRSH